MADDPLIQVRLRVVTAAQWADVEHTIIEAVVDGASWFVPDDPSNAYRQAISAWEAAGNTIAEYSGA